MCYIKKGEAYQILSNGFVVYKNKSYPLSDCTFEDSNPSSSSVQEIEVDQTDKPDSSNKNDKNVQDSKIDKSELKKEPKPKKEKKVSQPVQAEHHDEQPALINDQTETDMPPIPQAPQPSGLNVQIPNAQQILTPQQLLQLQQLQQQFAAQQALQAQQQQVIPQQVPAIPQPAVSTSNTVPGDKPKSEIQVPEELKMLQDFMHLTGGNIFVAVALLAAALFYKQWKAKNEGKSDNSQIDAHTSVCDLERKDISAKVSALDSKLQKLQALEERISSLEENSEQDINLGFSEEIEERMNVIEKHIKDISKQQIVLERKINNSSESLKPEDSIVGEGVIQLGKPRGRKPKA
jgi:hypothetical protein